MTHDISGRSRRAAFLAWQNRFSPSLRKGLISLVLIIGAAVVGVLAWSGKVLALPVACFFPALWARSPTRNVSALVGLAYFLAASRGLPEGFSNFYATGMLMGVGLWLAASPGFVVVHAVLWTSKVGWHKPVRYAVALILMSVPPFGITGWAGPVTAAGVLFPGWGWSGLALTVLGLSVMTMRAWPFSVLVFGTAFAISAATWSPPISPKGWVGIDTAFSCDRQGPRAGYAQQQATLAHVRQTVRSGASAIVLPESAFGIWTPTTERYWVKNLTGIDAVVLGGATVVNTDGYENVMVEVSQKGARVIYQERMPVPVSMWRPWEKGGAGTHPFANPLVEFDGFRIASLICYEQLLIWPVLQSMIYRPEFIVAIGNGWWIGKTQIVAIQKANAIAWASLFAVPVVMAVNR